MRIGEWLQSARQVISTQNRETVTESSLDLQALLAHVMGKPRAWILAHPEVELEPPQAMRLERLLERLKAGEPLPYLIEHWEFYGLDFEVTPAVLIPRPETEILVERGIIWLRCHPSVRLAADIGTGSGCIAVTLAKHIPELKIIAVDRSWEALQVARRNAQRHNVIRQIHFVLGDLLAAIRGPMNLACANLPYIPDGALANLAVSRYEPRIALDGGPDGLASIRALLDDAPRWLSPGGLLLLEMQFDQGEAIAHLAQSRFPEAQIKIINDLAGLPRVIAIENNES